MKMISVNEAVLKDIVFRHRMFVSCENCPIYDTCKEGEHNFAYECVDDIMRFLKSGKDYGEKF